MRNNAEEIKERLSITEVVSNYLKLEKAGINFRARCPFHQEKTPSFYVSPNRNSFHCFGCGKGGDIFTFVELIEGLNFQEALLKLAEKAGVKIQRGNFSEDTNKKNVLSKINEEAMLFFEENLKKNNEALKYLKSRGLEELSIKKFHIGFANDSWKDLFNHLKTKNFKENEIIESGVCVKTEKGIMDRFRSRIIFPLIDTDKIIVGFSSRIFPPDKDGPKYINSPETLLFKKSKFLYGLNLSRQSILKKESVIVVEGQMDLILAEQAGIDNIVAVSGTALTENHINIMKRFTNKIIYCFDSDEAGRKATIRAFILSFENDLTPKAFILPPNLDPADLAKTDKEKFIEVCNKDISAIEWIIKTNKIPKDNPDFLSSIKKEILPILVKISSNIDKDYSIKTVAEILGIKEESIHIELSKNFKNEEKKIELKENKEEKKIIDILIEKIIGLILIIEEKDTEFSNKIKERLKNLSGFDFEEFLMKKIDETKKETLKFQIEFWAENEVEQKNMIEELIDNFELEYLNQKLEENIEKLKKTEKERENTDNILNELSIISNKINELKIKNLNIKNYEKE